MSMTSDTPAPPPGYHITTEQERQCLPEGSRMFHEGVRAWIPSDLIGKRACAYQAYACPDQPEVGKAEGEADPWGKLDAALAQGKRIQAWFGDRYEDVSAPNKKFSPSDYRIHPDDLAPPAHQPSPEPAHPWQPAVGDTVRLKSGGPVMVVKKTGEYVTCLFNTETGPHQCQVPTACLTPAQP